jgi:FAD-dependent fumarate reductase
LNKYFLFVIFNNKILNIKKIIVFLYYRGKMQIVIIGSGLSGLVAALTLEEKSNHDITILEKEEKIGGNSIKASTGIAGIGPQKDSEKDLCNDIIKSGKGYSNYKLANTLAKHAKKTILWLKNKGADLSVVVNGGGHSHKRVYRPKTGGVGKMLVDTIKSNLKRTNIINNAHVIKLLSEDNHIYGVRYIKDNKVYSIETPVVVLATGGYGFNKNLLRKYIGPVADTATTNGSYSTGDGILMGSEIGGTMIDMDKVQLHPTGFVDPKDPYNNSKFLAPELFRSLGAKLINENNQRFCDELGTRDYVTSQIKKQKRCYMVFDQEIFDKSGQYGDFYMKKGFIQKGDNGGYRCEITPCIHYTMGGLKINKKGKVINENGHSIKGLYAAGETTGGLHGENRLVGNSLLECVVFGRIIGKHLSKKDRI